MKLNITMLVCILSVGLLSCKFPDCDNVPDRYYDLYDDAVTHYVQLNEDHTFLHYYKKEGKEYSHTGEWWIKEGRCTIELDTWIVYSEKTIKNMDGWAGIKFGTELGNMLFWPYDYCLEDHPDDYLQGFIRESYVPTYKDLVEKARVKDSIYWAATDTLYYDTGEIKEIGKRDTNVDDGYTKLLKRGSWREFYKSGAVKGIGGYRWGIKNRLWKYYYETGELESLGFYESNLKIGPWEVYHKNGVLKEKGVYIYITIV